MEPDTTIHNKALGTPAARELAELHLMDADLHHANRAFKIAFDMAEEGPGPDHDAIRISLIRDALVQFCACFGKRESYRLDKHDVFKGVEGWESLFDYMLAKRDSYAAHRFGPDRQCEIVAAFQAGFTPEVGEVTMVWTGFAEQDRSQVLQMVGIAGRYVEEKIVEAKRIVNEPLAAMTQEELLVLPNMQITVAGNARQSRERHRAKPG